MTAAVLLHDSHADGSGAPGERAYVADLNGRLGIALAARGFDVVRVPGDEKDHPAFHRDYAAFIAPHYDADIYGHAGGAFWDRAASSVTAARDDDLGARIWSRFREIAARPPDHFERRNANTRDYYGFRLTTARTPGVILELGVGAPVCNGHGAPSAPDHAWLRENADAIAAAVGAGVLSFYFADGGTSPVAESPFRIGQSADLKLAKGEVGTITGLWKYPSGNRSKTRKVYGLTPGRRVYTMYPDVDPDADPTEDVSAEPAIFIVDTNLM